MQRDRRVRWPELISEWMPPLRKRSRIEPTLVSAIGQSLPLGYAAISIAPSRRRRGASWLWALASVPAMAVGLAVWVIR